MSTIASELKRIALRSEKTKLCGRNLMARDLFCMFLKQSNENLSLLLLITSGGRILYFAQDGKEEGDTVGRTLLPEDIQKAGMKLSEFAIGDEFAILTTEEKEIAQPLQSLMSGTIACFDANEQRNENLLKALDVLQNAVSISDANGNMIFANRRYWEDFHIYDKEKPVGMYVKDIMEKYGVNFRYFEPTQNGSYKMFDVLNSGEEAIDWEVRVEYPKSGDASQLVSNDMYPLKDEDGNVTGMIEITHSRLQDLKTVRKIVGLSADYTFADIVGTSKQIQQKIHIAEEYAKSNYSILITGESGVGKELFAQSIHNYSPKRKGPFVALNCANFPENLIESELFGYVAGAFTGASKKGGIGKFELANHGTLFLDEIGELPYHFQPKLLRVLETMTVTRIGSNQGIPIDVRIVAATNRDLREMVRNGLFREDLYFRLGVLNVEIPPLRERKDDLMQLAEALLMQAKEPAAQNPKRISEEGEKILKEYDWPGNVRELRNVLSRASILTRGDEIPADILKGCMDLGMGHEADFFFGRDWDEADASARRRESLSYDEAYREYLDGIVEGAGEDDGKLSIEIQETQKKLLEVLIRATLEHTGGNKKRAAELLQISRKTLYNIMKREMMDV